MFDTHEAVFTALADATRRDLLTKLAQDSPRTATQLAKEYPITRQGIMKHLDLLAQAGLVQAQSAGREKRYTFTPQPLSEVNDWIAALNNLWAERLQRLKDFIENDPSLKADG